MCLYLSQCNFSKLGNNGGLPNSFARLHVSFSFPLREELLCHMYKVCALGFPNFNPQGWEN